MISKQIAVLRAYAKDRKGELAELVNNAADTIERLSTWIPIAERLPKDRDWYLGIFRESNTGWINPIPYVCMYRRESSQYTTADGWILKNIADYDSIMNYFRNLECVAWMPLPEPYKEEKNG